MNNLGKLVTSDCKGMSNLENSYHLRVWKKNSAYLHLYDRAKASIKKDTTMTCNEKEQLYIEDMLGVGLGASLLQVRDQMQFLRKEAPNSMACQPIVFVSKRLTSTNVQYSIIEREALNTLHDLKKFHHYCFNQKVSMITDHQF